MVSARCDIRKVTGSKDGADSLQISALHTGQPPRGVRLLPNDWNQSSPLRVFPEIRSTAPVRRPPPLGRLRGAGFGPHRGANKKQETGDSNG